jgi:hypothetical protein
MPNALESIILSLVEEDSRDELGDPPPADYSCLDRSMDGSILNSLLVRATTY